LRGCFETTSNRLIGSVVGSIQTSSVTEPMIHPDKARVQA
jgi:hypothetical protein